MDAGGIVANGMNTRKRRGRRKVDELQAQGEWVWNKKDCSGGLELTLGTGIYAAGASCVRALGRGARCVGKLYLG